VVRPDLRALGGVACVAVLVAQSSRARAEPATPAPAAPVASERIHLVYGAPAECPSAATFHDEVRSRVNGDWEAAPGELARRITISVTRRDDRYVAAIAFTNPAGQAVSRSVAGEKCEDVVNGIALVTALAIESRVEEALQQSEPEPARTGAPAPNPTPAPAPKVEPRAAARRASAPSAVVEPGRAERPVHVRFGASSVTSTGVGPDAAFGPAFFAAVELSGPRLGLSGAALWSGLVHTGGVPARFQRLSARADGCPAALGGRALSFEPCAFMELGSLHGQGHSTARVAGSRGGSSLWAAPGLLMRVLTRVDPVVLVLELDAGVPLSRQRFGVVTDGQREPSFKVPVVVFGGALGAGVRL
jgi:hypothetical protein